LEDDLQAFNERVVELENSGHRGHALEILKANAIDTARKIDELRSLLTDPHPLEKVKTSRIATARVC
jgi:hypothetical protein